MRSNILRDIEWDLFYTKVLGVVSQYVLRSGSLWDPLNSSMLNNKRIFISKFKVNVSFLSMTVQLGVANNYIK